MGSSAIIGSTVYVFRLLLLFLTGKTTAGDLFTAFAIGGVTGSVFANALGASFAFHESRTGKPHSPILLNLALYASFLIGVGLYMATVVMPELFAASGKGLFFWKATGLSMIGGVVMVYAQRIRFRILHDDEERDVFGPDVMMNVLLLASVPFAFYLLGKESMTALYLLSALLAYIFYSSARDERIMELSQPIKDKLKIILPALLLFPIFIQASNGIFHDPHPNFSSDGKLSNLPIPISVFACYLGIVLIGVYRRASTSYTTIFFSCILMAMATLASALDKTAVEEAKLILLLQYILPMFALALGQAYVSDHIKLNDDLGLAKAFLYVLAIIVPLQLMATWYRGFPFLLPSVWLFSIYQHSQYVPVIFIGAFLVSLFTLWNQLRLRPVLVVLTLLMALYAAASLSMLATGFFLMGLFGMAFMQWRSKREKLPIVILLIAAILTAGYLQYNKERIAFKYDFLKGAKSHQALHEEGKAGNGKSEVVPPNISERVQYWRYYLNEISSNPRILLWGAEAPLDRRTYPSAHNYYLDFTYNFGLIALLPIITLLVFTCVILYQQRGRIYQTPGLAGLSFVVLFLLIVDNSFKVGLRQPYPGILAFFLWGVLLQHLYSSSTRHTNTKLVNSDMPA